MNWVLEHMGDADFNDPPPPPAAAADGGGAAAPTAAAAPPDPEALMMLTSMGFGEVGGLPHRVAAPSCGCGGSRRRVCGGRDGDTTNPRARARACVSCVALSGGYSLCGVVRRVFVVWRCPEDP